MLKNIILVLLAVTLCLTTLTSMAGQDDKKMIQRGMYITQIAGCNDCHTPGYAQSGGNIPVANWLTGSSVGFSGPWGVTYPKNLRNMFAEINEEEWVGMAKTMQSKPPMPWFILRDMEESDLRALYQFVSSLGRSGEDAPKYSQPGVAVNTPYIEFFPKNLPIQASAN